VLAPDLRGHGRGIRSPRRFRLADCADDVAAMLDLLDTGPVIAAGYSMGGPIAQLLWRRHPHLVSGLVFCATGAEFVPGNRERYAMTALMTVVAGTSRVGRPFTAVPRFLGRSLLGLDPTTGRDGLTTAWARKEMSRHSMRMVAEAGQAIGTYSAKHWIHEVDVPTTVIVTENDRAVSPDAQLRLAMAIPGAHINRIPDGHVACTNPEFGRKLNDACLDVQRRIETGWQPAHSIFEHPER
jgi:pimeloyl-ACP methyl ester carboxylesterase